MEKPQEASAAASSAVDFPGLTAPGDALGEAAGDSLTLQNEVLAAAWEISGNRLKPKSFTNKLSGASSDFGGSECFRVVYADGRSVKASDLEIDGRPTVQEVKALSGAARFADRFAGREIKVSLRSPGDGDLSAEWQVRLRAGSNYIQQRVSFKSRQEEELKEIVLLDFPAAGARVMGTVYGSPVVAGNMFFGFENPMSVSRVSGSESTDARVVCSLPYPGVLRSDRALAGSAVLGVVPEGQLRRGFLYYLERERAQPYRTFLHHNNGEDVGMIYWNMVKDKPAEAARYRQNQEQTWREIIEALGTELVERRGVVMDSFVHDFEWDDETLVWQFHNGFPKGFSGILPTVQKYKSSVGIWFSPFGGYPCKPARMKFGQQMGFEINQFGLSLAGPRYYARFRGACVDMLRKYGSNYFKFDGIAPGNQKDGPEGYMSDLEALIRLIGELRQIRPDVFVNFSTGSWPSPFWLQHADVIWRAGLDSGYFGKGSPRQQWITYRDNATLQSTARRGPLYPLSSLMLHGIMFNKGGRVKTFEIPDLIDELHAFFGSGTSLQELYIDPGLMKSEGWDALAETANWARANADVLPDTHWIGGDPSLMQIYGWASWSKRKGVLVLRNPNDQPGEFRMDAAKVFELPEGALRAYSLKSPWKADAGKPEIVLTAGAEHTFQLKPFEVVVFDALPQK